MFATKSGEKTCFGWSFGEGECLKIRQSYTPFTTFPLFLLLFLLFFFPSPPPSASGGEKLPGQAIFHHLRLVQFGMSTHVYTLFIENRNRALRAAPHTQYLSDHLRRHRESVAFLIVSAPRFGPLQRHPGRLQSPHCKHVHREEKRASLELAKHVEESRR